MSEAEQETFHGIVKADTNFKSSIPRICHRYWGIDGATRVLVGHIYGETALGNAAVMQLKRR